MDVGLVIWGNNQIQCCREPRATPVSGKGIFLAGLASWREICRGNRQLHMARGAEQRAPGLPRTRTRVTRERTLIRSARASERQGARGEDRSHSRAHAGRVGVVQRAPQLPRTKTTASRERTVARSARASERHDCPRRRPQPLASARRNGRSCTASKQTSQSNAGSLGPGEADYRVAV